MAVAGVSARKPPHDLEAEEGVLGAAMLSAEALAVVLERLGPEDFYRPTHRTVFGAMRALHARGVPVDPVTVASELNAAGVLAEVGGAPLLHTLVAAVPTAANAATYAATVAELARVRRVMDAGHRLIQVGYDEPARAVELARTILAGLIPDTDQPEETRRLTSGGSFILDAPKGIPAVWGSGEQVAWSEGEPLLLVGPTGAGKTTLAGQLVMARLGICGPVLGMPVAAGAKRVLYLACDRPAQVQRALARLVDEDDREALDERLVVWKGPPPADLARHPETLIRMCAKAGADTVFIDSAKDVALKLSDDEVGAALNSAFQRTVVEGVEVCGLHHQRKNSTGGGKPKAIEDVYGSTWLTAGAGSVILLWGQPGDPVVEFTHLKQPADPVGPFKVVHDHDRGTSEVYDPLDVLKLLLHRPGLTAPWLAEIVLGDLTTSDSDVERARRKLDRLVRDGWAMRTPGSKGGRGGGEPSKYYATSKLEQYGKERAAEDQAEWDASESYGSEHGGDHAP